jgi:hypothetical protein
MEIDMIYGTQGSYGTSGRGVGLRPQQRAEWFGLDDLFRV